MRSIPLAQLCIRKEGSSYIAGSPTTGVYVGLDVTGAAVLRALQHKSLDKVARQFPEVNVEKFVTGLKRSGVFTDSVFTDDAPRRYTVPSRLQRRHISWLFSWQMLCVLIAMALLAFDAVFKDPSLIPKPSDLFMDQSASAVLVSFGAAWLLVMLHEFGHYLAAVGQGIKAAFGLSTQLMFVVAVTDVSNLYLFPPKRRYKVLLAGMLVDLFILCACILLLSYLSPLLQQLSLWTIPVLHMIVLLEFLGILWQAFTFLQTDLYYVLETLLDVHNLHTQATMFLKNLFSKKKRVCEIPSFVLGYYSLFTLAGTLLLVWLFVQYSLPILRQLLVTNVANLYWAVIVGKNPAGSIVSLMILGASLLLYCIGLLNHHGSPAHPIRFSIFFSLLWSVITGLMFLFAVAALPFHSLLAHIVLPFSVNAVLWALIIYELRKEFSGIMLLLVAFALAFAAVLAEYWFFSLLHVSYLFSLPIFVGGVAGLLAASLRSVPLDLRMAKRMLAAVVLV